LNIINHHLFLQLQSPRPIIKFSRPRSISSLDLELTPTGAAKLSRICFAPSNAVNFEEKGYRLVSLEVHFDVSNNSIGRIPTLCYKFWNVHSIHCVSKNVPSL